MVVERAVWEVQAGKGRLTGVLKSEDTVSTDDTTERKTSLRHCHLVEGGMVEVTRIIM